MHRWPPVLPRKLLLDGLIARRVLGHRSCSRPIREYYEAFLRERRGEESFSALLPFTSKYLVIGNKPRRALREPRVLDRLVFKNHAKHIGQGQQ